MYVPLSLAGHVLSCFAVLHPTLQTGLGTGCGGKGTYEETFWVTHILTWKKQCEKMFFLLSAVKVKAPQSSNFLRFTIAAILKISDIWKLQWEKKQLVLRRQCQIYLSQDKIFLWKESLSLMTSVLLSARWCLIRWQLQFFASSFKIKEDSHRWLSVNVTRSIEVNPKEAWGHWM